MLLAVESGSRAWGFPSPDSDYDCRFLYVRPRETYLSLFAERDVIEFPPDGIFDVNGWDLKKALKLLLKGNAVVVEWLTSPYAYDGDPQFRSEMLALAARVLRPEAVALRWLRRHPGQAVAPMDFRVLIAESDLPGEVRAIVDDLMVRKAKTREMGEGLLPAPIGALIDAEFARAQDGRAEREIGDAARKDADAFFLEWAG